MPVFPKNAEKNASTIEKGLATPPLIFERYKHSKEWI